MIMGAVDRPEKRGGEEEGAEQRSQRRSQAKAPAGVWIVASAEQAVGGVLVVCRIEFSLFNGGLKIVYCLLDHK